MRYTREQYEKAVNVQVGYILDLILENECLHDEVNRLKTKLEELEG